MCVGAHVYARYLGYPPFVSNDDVYDRYHPQRSDSSTTYTYMHVCLHISSVSNDDLCNSFCDVIV